MTPIRAEHRRTAQRHDQDQRLHRGLPFRGSVLCLWELCDVIASIHEREKLAALGKRDRLLEFARPAAISVAWRRHRLQSRSAAVAGSPIARIALAGHAGATAFARLLATPRPLGMVLANPTTPIATRAHGHIGGRIVDDGQ